jgi:hypothetical protein
MPRLKLRTKLVLKKKGPNSKKKAEFLLKNRAFKSLAARVLYNNMLKDNAKDIIQIFDQVTMSMEWLTNYYFPRK